MKAVFVFFMLAQQMCFMKGQEEIVVSREALKKAIQAQMLLESCAVADYGPEASLGNNKPVLSCVLLVTKNNLVGNMYSVTVKKQGNAVVMSYLIEKTKQHNGQQKKSILEQLRKQYDVVTEFVYLDRNYEMPQEAVVQRNNTDDTDDTPTCFTLLAYLVYYFLHSDGE